MCDLEMDLSISLSVYIRLRANSIASSHEKLVDMDLTSHEASI